MSTNWAAGPPNHLWIDALGTTSVPNFQGGIPVLKQSLPLPPSNKDLRKLADGELGGAGCLYTGPTRITLRTDGKMDVVSPRTRVTNPGCGPGLGVDLPANGVVFVQNVPPNASTDLNRNPSATNTCSYKSIVTYYPTPNPPAAPTTNCGQPNGAGVTYPPGLGVPIANDLTNDSVIDRYTHTNGDLFLSGTLNGRLTIGTGNDIIVTNDIRYANTSTASDDLLGLIPQNSVKIFHPVDRNTQANLPNNWGDGNATIYAAILTVARSFMVQNYRYGNPMGNLQVRGAIAQKYRGVVGRSTAGSVPVNGFVKDYQYDTRLRVQSPPHFLDPVRTAWEVKTWSEVDVVR